MKPFDTLPDEAARQIVVGGLIATNNAALGDSAPDFQLFVRDEEGAVRRGVLGFYAGEWAFIEVIWVAPGLRGQGYGSRLSPNWKRKHALRAARRCFWIPSPFKRPTSTASVALKSPSNCPTPAT